MYTHMHTHGYVQVHIWVFVISQQCLLTDYVYTSNLHSVFILKIKYIGEDMNKKTFEKLPDIKSLSLWLTPTMLNMNERKTLVLIKICDSEDEKTTMEPICIGVNIRAREYIKVLINIFSSQWKDEWSNERDWITCTTVENVWS